MKKHLYNTLWSLAIMWALLSQSRLYAQVKSISQIEFSQLYSVLQRSQKERSVLPLYEYMGSDGKCGLRVRSRVVEAVKGFPTAIHADVVSLLQPVPMQYTIERGKFRVHYDTIGINTPALLDSFNNRIPNSYHAYAESVATFFNDVWNIEITVYGFDAPLQAGQLYDVYIVEYNGAVYGETFFGNEITTNEPIRYETSIQLDNDFKEYRTKGMKGLKITAAHEFHHAIQLGAYGYWGDEELYAYELTATWMESVVYPNIKDYLQYLPKYFNNFGGRSLNETTYDGYERVVWAIFLAKSFGKEIMPRIWAAMRQTPFLPSNGSVLQQDYNVTLEEAFATFTFWNYYTGYRADTVRYYSQGNEFPLFQPSASVAMMEGCATTTLRVSPLSSTMLRFYSGSDTIITMVANVDALSAIQRSTMKDSFEVRVAKQSFSKPCLKLNDWYYSLFISQNDQQWRYFYFVNNEYTIPQDVNGRDVVSPQPLQLSQRYSLSLPLGVVSGTSNVAIAIYTVSGLLRYSGVYPIISKYGRGYVHIPAEHLRGLLSSGVYIVVAKYQDTHMQWKVAVIR